MAVPGWEYPFLEYQHSPALIWIQRVQKSPAYQAKMQAKTRRARNMLGELRSGLHRVMPRGLAEHECAKFEHFMFVEDPFKGSFAIVMVGKNYGQFAFVVKEDAALFKLFWC